MLSNITISLILMFILIISGYLISSFFDLEIAYYMPYVLWLLGLVIFNMFLDKHHVNIYKKKTNSVGNETEAIRAVETTSTSTRQTETQENLIWDPKWNESYI